MARGERPNGRALAYTSALGFFGVGLMSWQLLSPESGLEMGFRRALDDTVQQAANAAPPTEFSSQTFGAGLWLSAHKPRSAATDSSQMGIGSEIAVSGRDGQMRRLQVVDVRSAEASKGLSTPTGTPMLLVTLRPVGQSSGGEIRVLVEAGDSARPIVPAGHSL
jgi:hypothetical protein